MAPEPVDTSAPGPIARASSVDGTERAATDGADRQRKILSTVNASTCQSRAPRQQVPLGGGCPYRNFLNPENWY